MNDVCPFTNKFVSAKACCDLKKLKSNNVKLTISVKVVVLQNAICY